MAAAAADASGKEHLDAYARFCRTSHAKLLVIWRDVGLTDEEAQREFQAACLRACGVWPAAVEAEETKRQEVRAKIEGALRDIARIQQQLGCPEQQEGAALELDGLDEFEVRARGARPPTTHGRRGHRQGA